MDGQQNHNLLRAFLDQDDQQTLNQISQTLLFHTSLRWAILLLMLEIEEIHHHQQILSPLSAYYSSTIAGDRQHKIFFHLMLRIYTLGNQPRINQSVV